MRAEQTAVWLVSESQIDEPDMYKAMSDFHPSCCPPHSSAITTTLALQCMVQSSR